ncbi:uncharacterized protein AB9X84_015465 isoform 2-T2 [Acanthopagrus schlegelii]
MKLNVVVLLSGLSVCLSGQSDPKQNENYRIICPKSRVEATVGEDVTLDCYFNPQQDVTKELFEWKFNKKERALVYRSRNFSTVDQAEKFRNRASLGSNGSLTEGKIPLIITNVREADQGTYSCSGGRERKSCKIQLIIELPKEPADKKEVVQFPSTTPKSTDPPKNNMLTIAGLAVGIPTVLIAAASAAILWHYCRKTNTTPAQNDTALTERLTSGGEPMPSGSQTPPSPERTGTAERRRVKKTMKKPETPRLEDMENTTDCSN